MYQTYNSKLECFKGNSKDFVCVVYDASGNHYDLTGFNAEFYAQKYPITSLSTIDISALSLSTDPSNGAIFFSLTPAQTNITEGDYLYQVVINNNTTVRTTVVEDKLTIKHSIAV